MHEHILVDRYTDVERKREITSCDRNYTVVKILFEYLVKYTETKSMKKKKKEGSKLFILHSGEVGLGHCPITAMNN